MDEETKERQRQYISNRINPTYHTTPHLHFAQNGEKVKIARSTNAARAIPSPPPYRLDTSSKPVSESMAAPPTDAEGEGVAVGEGVISSPVQQGRGMGIKIDTDHGGG